MSRSLWNGRLSLYIVGFGEKKISPIEDIDNLTLSELSNKMGAKSVFQARYQIVPVLAKLEIKYGVISWAYTEKSQ